MSPKHEVSVQTMGLTGADSVKVMSVLGFGYLCQGRRCGPVREAILEEDEGRLASFEYPEGG